MKNTVTINNITLTREQIEDAVKELNAPEPWIPAVGELFTSGFGDERVYRRIEDRAAKPIVHELWRIFNTRIVGVDNRGRVNGFPEDYKFFCPVESL